VVKSKWLRAVIATAVVLTLALSMSGCGPIDEFYSYEFGSTSAASTHYVAAAVLASIINTGNPDMKITVVESGATHDNLIKTQAGKLDGGFATSWDGMAMAYNGTTMSEYIAYGEWPELRMMSGYVHNYVLVVVLDHDDQEEGEEGEIIETLYDLHGKRFSAGVAGSVTEFNIRRQFDSLGIEPEWVSASYPDVIEMARNREIVGFARASTSIRLDASMRDLHSEIGITVLGWPEEDLEPALVATPGTSAHWVPEDAVEGLSVPGFYTMGHTTGIFVTTAIPQDVMYRMAKTYVDKWDQFARAWSAAGDWTPLETDLALLNDMVGRVDMPPLHAGVVQLMKERGYEVEPALIGPEYDEDAVDR